MDQGKKTKYQYREHQTWDGVLIVAFKAGPVGTTWWRPMRGLPPLKKMRNNWNFKCKFLCPVSPHTDKNYANLITELQGTFLQLPLPKKVFWNSPCPKLENSRIRKKCSPTEDSIVKTFHSCFTFNLTVRNMKHFKFTDFVSWEGAFFFKSKSIYEDFIYPFFLFLPPKMSHLVRKKPINSTPLTPYSIPTPPPFPNGVSN